MKLPTISKYGSKSFKPTGPTTPPPEEVIRIRVNPTDIDNAVQGNANSCAIARSFKRICNDEKARVNVSGSHITYSDGDKSWSAPLPPEVVAWYSRFDSSRNKVQPFDMQIVGSGKERKCIVAPEVLKQLKEAMAA